MPPPNFWPLDSFDPDRLFSAYADLTPLLPKQFSPFWGLNLVTQFLDALSPDLQEALQTNSMHSTPDLAALHSLCIAAVCQLALIFALKNSSPRPFLAK
jgi:hypothetical protein